MHAKDLQDVEISEVDRCMTLISYQCSNLGIFPNTTPNQVTMPKKCKYHEFTFKFFLIEEYHEFT